ncbi:MAG: substrate-binding domain-containing protein [Gammaproteobacteria bacterium]|nr:substrate-binding domain-containing protein [Gammaproteobacteria bacterium]
MGPTIPTRVLDWPAEAAVYPGDGVRGFSAHGSNLALDFHGDPATAELAVFSDGNHHMALEACVRAFVEATPGVADVFYTTTPPGLLVDALRGDGLALGNLRITRKPDVFIGPSNILDGLAADGFVNTHTAFAQSQGTVLLVRKGNPKAITGLSDLLSDDVILTCSNPQTETASFAVYREAVSLLAHDAGMDEQAIIGKLSTAGPTTVHSQLIHHREVPELIASGQADCAVIYYHLALRYSRIFPELFEFIDIGGLVLGDTESRHPFTRYHIGLVGDGGSSGEAFVSFMQQDLAKALYQAHGLRPL